MDNELGMLLTAAAMAGFIHTLLGPDHYLPFIMMASTRQWSRRKTAWITFICGLGHVLGSVLIGVIGIGAGLALSSMEWLESVRGSIAAWMLIGFGFAYMLWGLRQAWRNRPHKHWHSHADGVVHSHEHSHHGSHAHVHDSPTKVGITPWALFIIFVLGPCEVLIPLFMVPASQLSFSGMIWVAVIFGLTTISTMLLAVLIGTAGIQLLPLQRLERFTAAIAGFAILSCGLAMQLLGI